ncbi:MAG: hypothetical protein JSV33_15420 [bacterium]|nr:MAG: hypothetical protein JSV33_15420 [bacterium]
MMLPTARICMVLSVMTALFIFLGCSEDVLFGPGVENERPTIRLTNGPLEGDTTKYQVTFYWIGSDYDGTVEYYELIMVSGNPLGFDPADTTGPDKWTKTTRTDTIFLVKADKYDSTITINNNPYGKHSRTHTLFIRAVDDQGMRSIPAYRSFTAFTLAPFAVIEFPRITRPGQAQFLNPVVTFEWIGKDPIDSPWNYQEVDSIRYMVGEHTVLTIDELNQYPEKFENRWSPWIWYNEPNDSGKQTILGDDEVFRLNRIYFFAIQAKDEAGAVTSVFDYRFNVFPFMPLSHSGPRLRIYSTYFGRFEFIGTNYSPAKVKIMPGFPLKFVWEGDASYYGGYIATYRYGWDVEDLSLPEDWDVYASPDHTGTPEKKFYMGVHTLYIEAIDNFGTKTLAQIEVSIFPLAMDRTLLWVDDFPSGEFPQKDYAMPTEKAHDEFWLDICSRADGFEPDRDVFDCEFSAFSPDVEYIFRYKNIIWTFMDELRVIVWDDVVRFTQESIVGTDLDITYNYLLTYMKAGGHLWTLGLSHRAGGLAAVVPTGVKQFPLNLRCELRGTTTGCPDTLGTQCMAYRDYCVSILDKANAVIRRDQYLPYRDVLRDAMSYGTLDASDPITASHPDLPERLELWSKITESGRYFDPAERGFHYIEVYNPEYWMAHTYSTTQSCFHPIYRIRARNTNSPLNNTVVAFWTTKHAHVVAEAPGTIAAPSVHFGLPLWFFNRAQVNAIADAIFEEWQIRKTETK